MPTFRAETLVDFADQIFQAAGTPAQVARLVAASLVDSNLVGHDSHGVVRVVQYLSSIEQGQLDPQAQPTIRQETSVIALIDGHSGFGQVAAHKAMRMAIDKAQEHGM
ncbi:MAG: Ldh family oxidoreductase [Caldilineaceae bacterium]|nr:Ldh family oxidoreductase [Caldilineaceae bacterium]